jgi:hypothetical protein
VGWVGGGARGLRGRIMHICCRSLSSVPSKSRMSSKLAMKPVWLPICSRPYMATVAARSFGSGGGGVAPVDRYAALRGDAPGSCIGAHNRLRCPPEVGAREPDGCRSRGLEHLHLKPHTPHRVAQVRRPRRRPGLAPAEAPPRATDYCKGRGQDGNGKARRARRTRAPESDGAGRISPQEHLHGAGSDLIMRKSIEANG